MKGHKGFSLEVAAGFSLRPIILSKKGFTLLEVLIALAIVGGLLVTLIYSLNYHLGLVERQEIITVATLLAKGKMIDLEN